MCRILHIDSSSETGMVMLASEGNILAQKTNEKAKDHAAQINLMVAHVLEETQLELADVDAFAVISGPGSYTGLRIGLAAAKGFCYALDKPLIMHNKLEFLALQQKEKKQANYYAALLPARQEEYFLAVYQQQKALIAPGHFLKAEVEEALQKLSGNMLIAGSGMQDFLNIEFEPVFDEKIDLFYWISRAEQAYKCHDFVNLAYAVPEYLKQVYTHS